MRKRGRGGEGGGRGGEKIRWQAEAKKTGDKAAFCTALAIAIDSSETRGTGSS